tara:strand:+ start:1390 stop:2025 length:636 start_codon:yes stop_codon:yes gene_type:complete
MSGLANFSNHMKSTLSKYNALVQLDYGDEQSDDGYGDNQYSDEALVTEDEYDTDENEEVSDSDYVPVKRVLSPLVFVKLDDGTRYVPGQGSFTDQYKASQRKAQRPNIGLVGTPKTPARPYIKMQNFDVDAFDSSSLAYESKEKVKGSAIRKAAVLSLTTFADKDEAQVSKTAGGDFTKMKVAELKTELKKRGLKVGGKKAELLARLQKAN